MVAALISAALLGFVGAITLLRYGLIGRAVDDHPVCRACEFDLFNLPAERTACPECGADLKADRAVRTGNRRRRQAPLYSGFALLLLATALAVFVGTHLAGTIDAYRYLPDAWVERDARSSDPARLTTAWAELARRFAKNGLSAQRTARLVDVALRQQANPKHPWANEAGDFVEAARKAGALPYDKWLLYAKQAPHLWLRTRRQIGRGHPIAGEVVEDGRRAATNSFLLVRPINLHVRGDLVASHTAPVAIENFGAEQIGSGSFSYVVDVEEDRAAMLNAAAGKHAIEVVATLEVIEGHEMDPANQKPLFREQHVVMAAFDLVEPDAAKIELIPDDSPALRRQVEASILVQGGQRLQNSNAVMLRHSATNVPVPLAYRVTVRQAGKAWEGRSTHAQGSNSSGAFFIPGDVFTGATVDVTFEPDPAVALETIDLTRVWNGQLEFRDLPIHPPPPPATRR